MPEKRHVVGRAGFRVCDGNLHLSETPLSKRERQIMDIVFQAGELSAADVHGKLPNAPTYTAVRTMLRVLEEKNLLQHREEGRKYIYSSRKSSAVAGRSAMRRVLDVFFGGSLEDAVAAHLNDPGMHLDASDFARLREVIVEAEQAAKGVHKSKSQKR
jgi:BlaI family transcriptional regulator, penicillinase repressor